jgi:hypothetical protein
MSVPSILDVLDAVTRVSRKNPRVRAWWLSPRARLPLTGERGGGAPNVRRVVLAVESADDGELDCGGLEHELGGLLRGCEVTVRALGGDLEKVGMMRLLQLDTASTAAAPTRGAPRSSGAIPDRRPPIRDEHAIDGVGPRVDA